MRGHNTCRYYQCLMYVGLRTFGSLHKKTCRIGPGLCGTSENSSSRTFVNRGLKKGAESLRPRPFSPSPPSSAG